MSTEGTKVSVAIAVSRYRKAFLRACEYDGITGSPSTVAFSQNNPHVKAVNRAARELQAARQAWEENGRPVAFNDRKVLYGPISTGDKAP